MVGLGFRGLGLYVVFFLWVLSWELFRPPEVCIFCGFANALQLHVAFRCRRPFGTLGMSGVRKGLLLPYLGYPKIVFASSRIMIMEGFGG